VWNGNKYVYRINYKLRHLVLEKKRSKMLSIRKYNAPQRYLLFIPHAQHLHNNSSDHSRNHHAKEASLDIATSAGEFDRWFGDGRVAARVAAWDENRES
jgi:hypothetical protein